MATCLQAMATCWRLTHPSTQAEHALTATLIRHQPASWPSERLAASTTTRTMTQWQHMRRSLPHSLSENAEKSTSHLVATRRSLLLSMIAAEFCARPPVTSPPVAVAPALVFLCSHTKPMQQGTRHQTRLMMAAKRATRMVTCRSFEAAELASTVIMRQDQAQPRLLQSHQQRTPAVWVHDPRTRGHRARQLRQVGLPALPATCPRPCQHRFRGNPSSRQHRLGHPQLLVPLMPSPLVAVAEIARKALGHQPVGP